MSDAEQSTTAVLTNGSEVLLRQVHPRQFPGGKPSSEAFVPTEKDKGLLSTLRERVGPEEAHRRWTEDLGRESVGTFGVSVEEAEHRGLVALDDEAEVQVPDHASIDFNDLPSRGQMKKTARILRDHAVARGCLYTPEI